ncbi:MAG: hypothetical protein JWM10_4060 [Myxococcaceae bacterium]|nr:hypothetical protein [Myxococcaceae bacterium]
MTRDLVATATAALLPVFLLALTALAAGLAALIAQHIRDKRYGAAVTLLAYGAAGVAADFAQRVVVDLKDPARLGTWNHVVAATVRLRAVALLRALYPLAVDFVTHVLRDPAKVDALLGTLLERAVLDLKTRTATPVAIVPRDPETLPARVELSPPASEPETATAPADVPAPNLAGQSGRASVGVMLLTLALGLAAPFVACGPRPVPVDGGAVTPSGVLAAIDSIASLLDVLLPIFRPLLQREVPDGPAKPPVMISLQAFEAAGHAWLAGRSTWDARGADRCTAYALSGALTDATRQLARDLGRAGIGWGPDLDALLTSLGRLLDRQIGACPAVDGGALMTSGRVGETLRADLAAIEDDARRRGASLRPLPTVRR